MQIDIATDRSMIAAARKARPARRPWLALLSTVMTLAGGKAELVRHSERAWASALFSGTRHAIVLAFTGEEAIASADTLIARLPDHEFAIPGQLVAEVLIARIDQTTLPQPRMELELELLLLEDC
ncbi:MAG: hypothetical protein WCY11_04095 [Novosphingobium sp.]